jgi:hypothetical protein
VPLGWDGATGSVRTGTGGTGVVVDGGLGAGVTTPEVGVGS